MRAAAVLLATVAALVRSGWSDGLDDHPPILRSRIVEITTRPWVRDDVIHLAEEGEAPAALPGIGDAVELDPGSDYTFDVLQLEASGPVYECDDVEIGYDYRATSSLILRIGKGERIVFDAHVRARSRLRGEVPSGTVPKRDPQLVALFEEVVRPDAPCDDGPRLIERFTGEWSKPGGATTNVLVHIEQPGTENAVAA